MNDSTFEAKLSFRLTRMNVFIFISVFGFILTVLTVIIVAFTPLREYIPGYSDLKDREKVHQLSVRTDSIEYMTKITSAYIDSLYMILSGAENISKIDYEKFSRHATPVKISESHLSAPQTSISDVFESYFYYKPAEGIIVQEFSPAMNHFGIDIVTAPESSVRAVRDGTVIHSRWNPEYGNILIIQHPNNIVSIYKHISVLLKKEGDYVKGGEVVSISGNTGEMSTGPHLHVELWINGSVVNPAFFLNY